MIVNRTARTLGGVVVTLGLLALAGCGSNNSSGSDTPASTSGDSTTAVASSELQSKVTQMLAPPTGIGLEAPLSRKPDSGKFIVGLLTPLPTAKIESAAQAAAAKLLGWKYQEIEEGTGPEDAAKALDAAVALKPDGIIYYGTPRQLMESGLEKAQAAGIAVVATAQVDKLAPPIIANNSNSVPQLAQLGTGIADYVAVNSKQAGHVALVNIPTYPVLAGFSDGFKKELGSVCSACKVTEVPQQLTDLGTVTPTSVVSALRRDPSIKYVIFDCGCAATGVEAAIQAAGISGVVLGGEAPLAPSIEELKSGADEAWAALSLPILGYGLIDTLARSFNGDSLDPVFQENPAWQILTADNIGTAVLDSQNNYVGYSDYATAYGKLWQVG